MTITMQAAVQRTFAEPEHITVETIEAPTPQENEVLIDVHAAGVDRGVWHLATGKPYIMRIMGFGFRRLKQPVQGTDVAGKVKAIGPKVTRFRVGDAVMGSAEGSFAQLTVASENKLVGVPSGLSLTEAAAMPVSGLTAIKAVVDITEVSAGQRVLILGASGGVGSFAVQLASAAGARVTGVCSSGKAALVKRLGAVETIDYATEDVTTSGAEYDVIIDIGGRLPLRGLRRILAPRGKLVIVGGEGGGPIAGGFGRQLRAATASMFSSQQLSFFLMLPTVEALDELVEHIKDGTIRAAVTAKYPLSRAADAVVDLAAGRIAGKAVVTVSESA